MLEAKRHLVYQVNMFRLQEKTQMSMLVRRRERGGGGGGGGGGGVKFWYPWKSMLIT